MLAVFYTFMFVFGTVFGSFMNVCICRIPLGQTIAKGRSACPACGHTLGPPDLFPLLSFAFLGGRCRYCRAPISWRYPLVELLTGLLFMLALAVEGVSLRAVFAGLLLAILVGISFIDADTGLIPDSLLVAALALSPAFLFLPPRLPLWEHGIGFLAVSLPMLLMAMLGGFGGGDVKLMAVAGLLLGWKLALMAFFIAVVLGGFGAAALLLLKKAHRKSEIAFGPYLCAGITAAWAMGPPLLEWYASLLRL